MSLAWHGIRLRKRMRTLTFWLALVHISLMCCVKLRFSSIFTPSSLICSVCDSADLSGTVENFENLHSFWCKEIG